MNIKNRFIVQWMLNGYTFSVPEVLFDTVKVFPLPLQFFSKVKKLSLNQQGKLTELEKYVVDVMGKFIFDVRTRINIDDLFTLIEIEIERNYSWELLAYRQQLFKLIQSVLIRLGNQIHDGKGEYNDFLSRQVNPFGWRR